MMSKNFFWKLSKLDFKNRIGYFIICLLASVGVICTRIIINLYHYTVTYGNKIEEGQVVVDFMQMLSLQNVFLLILPLAMAVILGITGSMWNNKQNQNDFYVSLPVKSNTRYAYIHLNSLLGFLICFGGSLLFSVLLIGICGHFALGILLTSLVTLLVSTLLFISVYFIIVISQYLTGNNLFALIIAAAIISLEPVVRLLYNTVVKNACKTLPWWKNDVDVEQCAMNSILSPLMAIVKIHTNSLEYNYFSNRKIQYWCNDYTSVVIFLSLQILIFGVLSYILYKKRMNYSGNKRFVFEKITPVIKTVIFVCLGVFLEILISETISENILIKLICIAMAVVVMHIIFAFSSEGLFKDALKKGRTSSLISGAIIMIIILSIDFGSRKYDEYLPNVAELDSISVTTGADYNKNFYDDYGNIVQTENYFNDKLRIKDPDFINLILSNVKSAMDDGTYTILHNDDLYSNYEENYELFSKYCELCVSYNLKNGKTIVKNYCMSIETSREIYYAMCEIPEYIELTDVAGHMKELDLFDKYYSVNFLYRTYGFGENTKIDKEHYQEILQALSNDYKKHSYDRNSCMYPIGELAMELHVPINEDYGEWLSNYISIYKEDEETIALLEKIGIPLGSYDKKDVDKISITIMDYEDIYNYEYDSSEKSFSAENNGYDYILDKIVLNDYCDTFDNQDNIYGNDSDKYIIQAVAYDKYGYSVDCKINNDIDVQKLLQYMVEN